MLKKLLSFFKNRTRDGVLAHGLMFFGISIVIAFLNFLFNVIMARMLGKEGFGIFIPLISVFYILNVPGRTIQIVSSKYIAIYKNELSRGLSVFQQLLKIIFVFSLLMLLAVIIFSGKLQVFLHLETVMPVYILSAVIIGSIIFTVFIGAAQGLQHFVSVGMSQLAATVLRVLSGVFLVRLGFYYNGALTASVISVLSGILILYFVLRRDILSAKAITPDNPDVTIKLKDILKEFIPVFLFFLFFQISIYMDDIIVRHYLIEKAGVYSAASRIGKMVFFIAPAINMVIFPKITSARDNLRASLRILAKGIILILMLAGFGELIFIFFSEEIIILLFKKEYIESAYLIKYVMLAAIPYAVMLVLSNYFIARNKYHFIITFFILTVLQIIGYVFFHNTLMEIIAIMVLTGTLLLIISIGTIFYDYMRGEIITDESCRT